MTNRGLLGKWGPNHGAHPPAIAFSQPRPSPCPLPGSPAPVGRRIATLSHSRAGPSLAPMSPHTRSRRVLVPTLAAADPIVTREKPAEPWKLQMVAIKRRDTGDWAIPGGMVDPHELVSVTLKREFTEEACAQPTVEKKLKMEQLLQQLFAADNGHVIYSGYVDDPRNTDNAWMETVAMHFHCPPALGKLLLLHAGDDAAEVQWLDIDEANEHYRNLYASHKGMVNDAIAELRQRQEQRPEGAAAQAAT